MGSFQIEADGGARGNPGPAAYGAVVLDEAGIVRHLAGALGIATNNVAEYTALVVALEWIAEHLGDDHTVDVRLDSKLVVEQMSGNWKIKHPDMRTLAVRARNAYPATLVTYAWVPREQNKRADALVNEILDDGTPGLVINRAP